MKTRLTLTIAIAGLVIQTPFANADTFESSGSGAWDAAASWTCTAGACEHDYPINGDTATIKAGDTIHVDSSGQRVDNLTVEQGATKGLLDIRAGGALQIDDSLTMQTGANQDGEINFSATSTPRGSLTINGDMTAAGPIKVTGSEGGSIASVDAADTLTIQNTVSATSGPLTLSAEFDLDGPNGGKLLVDGPYTLTIDTYGPTAGSTGRFVVNHASGSMVFAAGTGVTWTTSVTGPYFDIPAGSMTFNDTFGSEAAGRMQGGSLTVAAGKSFTADEAWVNP